MTMRSERECSNTSWTLKTFLIKLLKSKSPKIHWIQVLLTLTAVVLCLLADNRKLDFHFWGVVLCLVLVVVLERREPKP